jgi:recombination protein RecA
MAPQTQEAWEAVITMSKATKKKPASAAASLAAEINHTLKLDNPILLGSDEYFTIQRIPTGSLVLDRIIGGGFALGRHYELYGSENAGKSTILYMTMALSQQRGNICAMVDPEHSFDNERFEFLGGKPKDLLAFWPEDADEAVAVMMMLATHANDSLLEVIGIDSVSSLLTSEERGKDPREKDQPATQARMMSRALRRITTVNKKTLFLWTNQERVDVGVKFGNPNTTSGGKALRYYATGRIEFRRGAKLMRKSKVAKGGKLVEAEIPYGRWTQMRVEKEKSTRPQREGAFVFNHDKRIIDPAYEIIQLGLEDGLIDRSATGVYSYTDIDDYEWKGTEKKFVGMLYKNPDLREELESVIIDNTIQLESGGDDAG